MSPSPAVSTPWVPLWPLSAQQPQGIKRLFDQTLAAPANSFDINPLETGFDKYILSCYLRMTTAALLEQVGLRFNNSSVAEYYSHQLHGAASAAAAIGYSGLPYIKLGNMPGASVTAGFFGMISAEIDVSGPLKTTLSKWWRNASSEFDLGLIGGSWNNLAAVNRMTILPYNGQFAAGSRCTLYGLGQSLVGTTPAGTVTYGTTLPNSPADGQEAILVDSLTNPSYQWRFRYNAGSTSPYKWEFVGGSLTWGVDLIPTYTATSQSSYADVPGASVILPRAGDWTIEWGFDNYASTVGAYTQSVPKLGNVATTDNNSLADSAPQGVGGSNTHSRRARFNGAAAGDNLRIQAKSNSGNGIMRYGFMYVTPVRVS